MPLFQGYQPHPSTLRTPLLGNPKFLHGAPPSTDDLIALQEELNALKAKTTARVDKAKRDLELLQSKWNSLSREKERSKETLQSAREKLAKRIKREASETPSVDDYVHHDPRPRHASGSVRKSDADRKKKRKRDERRASIDPDVEMLDASVRLSPSPALPPPERPQKKPKHSSAAHIHPSAQLSLPPPPPPGPPVDPDVATDFSLPNAQPFTLQPRLELWGKRGILRPTWRHAYEVNDDFTNTKAPPQQTLVSQFWKETESWMKPVGEEDVAWLRYSTDDTDLFSIPQLGRHYTEVWEEQEQLLFATQQSIFPDGSSMSSSYQPPSSTTNALGGSPLKLSTTTSGGQTSWADQLTENDLSTQKKGLGPFTERILSALLADPNAPAELPPPPPSTNGVEELPGSSQQQQPNGTGQSAVVPAPVSFYDLETRIRMELKACGLLGAEEPDFNESYDDDIASTLRHLQSKLRTLKSTNDARKDLLSSIARDRLAYHDYLDLLDDLNRQIHSGHARIVRQNQKANAAIVGKNKKKGGGSEKEKERAMAVQEAALEMARIRMLVVDVPEGLGRLVELRRQFKEAIGKAMQEWENRQPGRLMGAPLTSIYENLRLADGSAVPPEEEDEDYDPISGNGGGVGGSEAGGAGSRLGSVVAS